MKFFKTGQKRYDTYRKEIFFIRKRILDCLYTIEYKNGLKVVEHFNFIESNTESVVDRRERIGLKLIK